MRLALLALISLPLAACDTQAMSDLRRTVGIDKAEAEPEEPAGPRAPAVSPLVQPIETGTAPGRAVPTAEPLTYRATNFVAGGNEPFWNVEISDNTATYRTPENQSGRKIDVNRLVFDRGVEYIGVLNDRPFVLNLTATECQDTMADKTSPLTARLTISGKTQQGCGAVAKPPEAAPAAG
jgi:uncharacterized membrane protein